MITRLALVALLFAACTGDDNEVHTALLLGTWETHVDTVRLGATFAGEGPTANAKLSQITPGDTATCEIGLHTDGTFSMSGTITITVTSARQRTSAGCSGGETDTAVADLSPLQSFAAALSGPFSLTKSTLKLGSSYPTFARVSP